MALTVLKIGQQRISIMTLHPSISHPSEIMLNRLEVLIKALEFIRRGRTKRNIIISQENGETQGTIIS